MNQHGQPVRLRCALALLWRARRASSPGPIHRSQHPVVDLLAALHRSDLNDLIELAERRADLEWVGVDIRVRQVFVQRNQRLVEPSQRDQRLHPAGEVPDRCRVRGPRRVELLEDPGCDRPRVVGTGPFEPVTVRTQDQGGGIRAVPELLLVGVADRSVL